MSQQQNRLLLIWYKEHPYYSTYIQELWELFLTFYVMSNLLEKSLITIHTHTNAHTCLIVQLAGQLHDMRYLPLLLNVPCGDEPMSPSPSYLMYAALNNIVF